VRRHLTVPGLLVVLALALLLAVLALAQLLFAGGPLAGQGKDSPKAKGKGKDKKAKPALTSYYPLKVGNTWEYRVGQQKLTVRVAREEAVGKVSVAVLESTFAGKTLTERVALEKDGVYRYSGEGVDYQPPLCFLKLPPKKDETWEVKSRGDGLNITGTFTAGEETVTVPAGMYEAVTSFSQDFRVDQVTSSVTYWFVPGIGMVKQRLKVGGRDVVIELAKYTPAK
jgi:hypothetical protein